MLVLSCAAPLPRPVPPLPLAWPVAAAARRVPLSQRLRCSRAPPAAAPARPSHRRGPPPHTSSPNTSQSTQSLPPHLPLPLSPTPSKAPHLFPLAAITILKQQQSSRQGCISLQSSIPQASRASLYGRSAPPPHAHSKGWFLQSSETLLGLTSLASQLTLRQPLRLAPIFTPLHLAARSDIGTRHPTTT